jgi:hypothetical protein
MAGPTYVGSRFSVRKIFYCVEDENGYRMDI